jgi:hypothetical protein
MSVVSQYRLPLPGFLTACAVGIPIFILLLFFIRCGDAVTFIWEVSVETDKSTYNWDELLQLTIENHSDTGVLVHLCSDSIPEFTLLKRMDSMWETVYIPHCEHSTGGRILLSGDRILRMLDLSEISNETGGLQGTYRIRVKISGAGDSDGTLLPERILLSNIFTIVGVQS